MRQRRAGAGTGQSGGSRLAGGGGALGCASCYHIFGVDLIADRGGEFRVIEVNVQPDLTLSQAGCAAAAASAAPASTDTGAAGDGCWGGSFSYDHAKRAAAYNAVSVVYADRSAAATLARLLTPLAGRVVAFPRLLAPDGGLAADALSYLLEAVREGAAAGCLPAAVPLNCPPTCSELSCRRCRRVLPARVPLRPSAQRARHSLEAPGGRWELSVSLLGSFLQARRALEALGGRRNDEVGVRRRGRLRRLRF